MTVPQVLNALDLDGPRVLTPAEREAERRAYMDEYLDAVCEARGLHAADLLKLPSATLERYVRDVLPESGRQKRTDVNLLLSMTREYVARKARER